MPVSNTLCVLIERVKQQLSTATDDSIKQKLKERLAALQAQLAELEDSDGKTS